MSRVEFPPRNETQERNIIEQTAHALEREMKGKVLIQFDRFGQAMRNTYSLPAFGFLRPEVSVCHYNVWSSSDSTATQVYSRELLEHQRTKTSGTSYDLPFTTEIDDFLNQVGRQPIFKVWFSTSAREELAQQHGAIMLSVSAETRDYVEGKTNLPSIMENAGTNPESRLRSISFSDISEVPDYQTINESFGGNFVMQGKSIGGDGTKIVRTLKDFDLAREKLSGSIKITEFFVGYSSNTTVLILPNGIGGCTVYIDVPSHKPTGISDIGVHDTLGGGNDWSEAFPEELLQKFVSSVEAIGQYLYHNQGLVGIWGVDSMWSDDTVKINEINCRLQGTTEASAVNQVLREFPPFIALHFLAFLGGDTSFLPSQNQFNQETVRIAAQDHLAPYYIKMKAKFEYPVRLKSRDTMSGKYKLENGELVFINHTICDIDANLTHNEVIVADLPNFDTICYPGSELCTVTGMTSKKVFDGAHQLSQIGQELTQALYHLFEKTEE